MDTPLTRRALAELVGTAFLVAAVIGSGIAASRLSPTDVGLELLENSLITGGALTALILALQPVSAAFNPVVTVAEAAARDQHPGGRGSGRGSDHRRHYRRGHIQLDVPATRRDDLRHYRSGASLWLGEVIATLGLLVVIFGMTRAKRANMIAFAVGAYIIAAYWFTRSTSFANPAVTIARMFSNTFAGIAPSSAPMFVIMQLAGGVLALGQCPGL